MRENDVVMIYDDPINRKKEEGLAKLVEIYLPDEGDGLEVWVVKFVDDGFETVRVIYKGEE